MSASVHTITVVLEKDLSEDYTDSLVSAIKHLRGVSNVKIGGVDNFETYAAEVRVRQELGSKLIKLIHPELYPETK